MANEETLDKDNPTSAATFKPIDPTSVAMVEGDFEGSVFLQMKIPSGSKWFTVLTFTEPRAVPVSTPDTGVDYRYHSEIKSGSALTYFGASS